MADNACEEHPASYGVYVKVWAALLCFTALTVGVADLQLGGWSGVVSVAIASAKASLVLLFFMHLKYEPPVFRYMFLVTLGMFTIFILLTYADYLTRFPE